MGTGGHKARSVENKKKGGYGLVYQDVMRNRNLSVEAKAIYAYLSSLSGTGNVCYPSIETIQKDMGISKGRLSKYMHELTASGVVEKIRERDGNLYSRNVYKITHEAEVVEDLKRIFRAVENQSVENRESEGQSVEYATTNNNNTNINNINNNSINNTCAPEPHGQDADKAAQLEKEFEIIYGIYPKKRGRTGAFASYKAWVGKGKDVGGRRYRLSNKQIYLAVRKYIRQQEEAGQDDLTYWKNFDTLMGRQLLDYVDFKGDGGEAGGRQQEPVTDKREYSPEYKEMYDKYLGKDVSDPDGIFGQEVRHGE